MSRLRALFLVLAVATVAAICYIPSGGGGAYASGITLFDTLSADHVYPIAADDTTAYNGHPLTHFWMHPILGNVKWQLLYWNSDTDAFEAIEPDTAFTGTQFRDMWYVEEGATDYQVSNRVSATAVRVDIQSATVIFRLDAE